MIYFLRSLPHTSLHRVRAHLGSRSMRHIVANNPSRNLVRAPRRPSRSASRRASISRVQASSRFTSTSNPTPSEASTSTRRAALLAGLLASGSYCAFASAASDVEALQATLVEAYGEQDFVRAVDILKALRRLEPEKLEWVEAEATVLVDAKKFDDAIRLYDQAFALAQGSAGDEARVLAGRALAYEGVYKFEQALADYDAVLKLCADSGFAPDPYVLNSRGNVRGSLGDWRGAREDYSDSAELFQSAKGFRNGASTTQRLDAAIYAFSNVALADVQLGNQETALKQIEALVRRAPNSADMRAAQAILYYDMGRFEDAEDAWERACSREVGCAKYKDLDYVTRIRRWPPAMVDKLKAFLEVR